MYFSIFVSVSGQKKHITIHDIARELGISASTVSRALKDNPRISKRTRETVQRLALSHQYMPNQMASNLRKGKSNTVGVIVPNVNRSFFSHIIDGVEQVLSAAGYNLMICQSFEKLNKEKEALNTLFNARVDGILMSLSMETDTYGHIEEIANRNMKMVFFDRIPVSMNVASVIIDDYHAALKVTSHILSRGCRYPAHIGGSSQINVYGNRQMGFRDALLENQIPIDERYIIETDMTREGGMKAFEQLMKLSPRPDAVMCSGDLTAHGVMIAAEKMGLRIPYDLTVSGFANEEFTAHITPPLTSVDQKGALIGHEVAKLFLENEDPNVKKQIIIEPDVKLRQSTAYRVQTSTSKNFTKP